MAAHSDFRIHEDDLGKLYEKYKSVYQLLGAGVLVLIGVWIGATLFADDSGYATNLYTEVISIGVTVAIIDQLNRYRDRRKLKNQLLSQVLSPSNDWALAAIDRLRHEGWLSGENGVLSGRDLRRVVNWEDGNLRKINLAGAKLDQANLSNSILVRANLINVRARNINLSGSKLTDANLSGANLWRGNLSGAYLWIADMSGARLIRTNLSRAFLKEAYLSDADLRYANLTGTILVGADLLNVDLQDTKFDTQTVLPDAKRVGTDGEGNYIYDKYWTPDTDMTRYTDPNHPDFWEPEWVKEQRKKGDGG